MTDPTHPGTAVGQPDLSRQQTSVHGALTDANFLSLVERLATNPAVDVQKLSSILDLQERVMVRQAEADFNAAYHQLSADLPRIKKNGSVEYKGKQAFKFATWDAIDDVLRPLLQREGFALSFDTVPRQGDGGGIIVTGTLSHVAGHKRSASIPVPLDSSGGKNSIQGYGSALSYGKRYCTVALVNLITEDDDDAQRAGMKFITDEQATTLRVRCEEAGQPEDYICQRAYRDGSVHNFNEIQAGGYEPILNTLDQMIHRNKLLAAATQKG